MKIYIKKKVTIYLFGSHQKFCERCRGEWGKKWQTTIAKGKLNTQFIGSANQKAK